MTMGTRAAVRETAELPLYKLTQCHMAEEVMLKKKPVLQILINGIFYNPPAGEICSILCRPLLFWVSCDKETHLILTKLVDVEGR